MNREEDLILHGLYSWREIIKEHIPVTAAEIAWLTQHSFAEGRHWNKDGKFQTLDYSQRPQETRFTSFPAKTMRPLLYLEECGLIKINRTAASMQVFEVTKAGAERARRLQTRWGRIDLWYRDRKEGIVGLWVPAVVAFITSLLTTWVLHLLGSRASG